MPSYTNECNQAPFEPFDPTLPGIPAQSTPSRQNLGNFSCPLCFDNDSFCLSRNAFLLITIWIAYVRERSSRVSLPSLFATLRKEQAHLPSFQSFAHSLRKRPGCTQTLPRMGQRPLSPASTVRSR